MSDESEKKCVLYDRVCTDCGECDRCDLDPNKICDNCMLCVLGDDEYRSVLIEGIEAPDRVPERKVPNPAEKRRGKT